jgi:hypothetical protein
MMKQGDYNSLEPARFSRTWWLSRTRNALFIALVTVLVWIYADVEFTDQMDLSATLQFVVPPGSNLVLRSDSRVEVRFKVQGRRSSLELLDQRLREPGANIRYQVAENETEVSTRDILNRSAVIASEGLTVVSASPGAVTVKLDTKIRVPDLEVKFDYTGAFPTEETVTPPRMGIQVARQDWEKIRKATPKPVLRTVRVDLKLVDTSKPFAVDLIRRIGELPVEPDQPAVTVSVKIAQLTETQELVVPVQVVCPPSWSEDGTWREYTLSRRDRLEWRAKIQVSGTRKDLDQLKGGDVQAYVVLTDDDKKPVSWLTRQVEVRMPDNLNLSLLGPKPTVTFKLEKAAPPTPP